MPQFERKQTILNLLKNFKGIEPLKQLFWSELNYGRINQPLSRRTWSEKVSKLLADDPLLFAAAGANNDFQIIYARLELDRLLLTQERMIVANLLREHPYALFVISNKHQDRWHLINVKYGEDLEKRRQFRRITIGQEERLRTASERISLLDLASLSSDLFGLSPLNIQERHDEAFDVEAVTKLFYEEYEAVFNLLQDDLSKQTNDKKWAHDYALQFLNRCMFLYFIQRKGWLANDREFLRTFWETYHNTSKLKDTFVEKWLNILFFDAFNNRFHGGHRHLPKDLIETLSLFPFLNGGLFSPNKDLDDRYEARISDKRFEQIFNFFERYNFTIAEDSPLDKEVAVDPEMIGKVYESLINVEEISPDQRSAAGIFYTPRIEIDLMCRLALVDNLDNHLGGQHKSLFNQLVFAYEPDEKAEADAEFHNAKLWPDLLKHLNEITIVDPACGSGSFLVGMLYVLDDLYRRAERQHGKEENSFERKKRIIGRSLYGVDVMDWACHVAELRLWLALIIDADFSQEELHFRTEPLLPNFSFNIRCGDSLVQELGGIALKNLHDIKGRAPIISSLIKSKISKLRNEKIKFYKNEPTREYLTLSDAKKYELYLFREILDDRQKKIIKDLDEKKKLIEKPISRQIRLDGKIEDISAQQDLDFRGISRQIKLMTEELDEITEAKAALGSIQDLPFIWEIAFVEIFGGDSKGFDIVLGNPPYVRQENIADPALPREEINTENKKIYKSKLVRSVYQAFPSFFGYKAAGDTVMHKIDAKSDLYIYFYFHGLSLLNSKGSFCFITSNSWLDVGYGKDLQEFLLKHCYIKLILDNQAKRSFAQADINTVIVLFSSPDESNQLKLEKTAKFVMIKVPFENILSSVIFEEIEDADKRKDKPEYRLFPATQKILLEEGWEWAEETIEDEKAKFGIIARGSRYGGNKWGGKYLRMPESIINIIKNLGNRLVPLKMLLSYDYGLKPGVVDFFYLDDKRVREFEIESQFLRPIINSSRDIDNYVAKPNALIFWCQEPKKKLVGTGAKKYIEWGEEHNYHRITSVKGHRPFWYSLNSEIAECILLQFWDRRFWTPQIYGSSFASNNFYCGRFTHYDKDIVLALLNSIIYFMQIECFGRTNQGQGVLATYGPEFAAIKMPLPKLFSEHYKDKIVEAYEALCKLQIVSIDQDVKRVERRELDVLILESLGISANLVDQIYDDMTRMVFNRIAKADST